MLLPLSWLKEYVDVKVSPEELATKLLSVGFEVEGIEYKGKDISGVVVGRIEKVEKHENSDHLQTCQVNVGEENGGVVQIVTGASNIFEGALIPAALVGAKLPGGIKIEKAKLRGVPSFGMMCSGGELKVSEAEYEGAGVNGILILKDDAKIGQDIKEYLGLDDVIFDISVTANRPDCQSILGMAREVAAVLGEKVKYPDFTYEEDKKSSIKDYLTVEVENSVVCPKYVSKVVDDVKFVETPKWMKKRLALVGHNSIDIIVDITNYVLVEMGQPMHAFDVANLEDRKIIVRNARAGETLRLLNEQEVELNDSVLVIADGKKPVAIAGIMGGEHSGINAETKTIAFESAKFLRDVVRKTSKSLGVFSDSSSRFQKGVDVYTVDLAMKRALHLITETGAGRIIGLDYDIKRENAMNKTLTCNVTDINKVLGIDIPEEEIIKILEALEFGCSVKDGVLTCKVPSYREDVDNFTDLAEEVIRYYGYQHITGTMMPTAKITHGGYSHKQALLNEIKYALVKKGYYEAITYSFTTPKMLANLSLLDKPKLNDPVKILNPLGEDVSIMRTSLTHSMLEVLANNYKKSNDEAKIFEVANIYVKSDDINAELPVEIPTLCVGEYGEKSDFYTIKGALDALFGAVGKEYELVRSEREFLHPGRSADVYVDGKNLGYLGEVHPDITEKYGTPARALVMEISLPYLIDSNAEEIKFSAFSRFQPAERDLAVIVNDDVPMKAVLDIIKESAGKLLTDVKLFDVYQGEQVGFNKKSLAFRLRFALLDKTLTDKEIEAVMDKIINNIEDKVGGKLR